MATQEGDKMFDTQVAQQETTEDSVERQELDLTNPDDLDLFLESAEGVYAEAFQYGEVAESDNFSSLGTDDLAGVEVFEVLQQKLAALQEMIDHCRLDVIPNEGEIDDDKIELMQHLYDDMIFLRNHIQESYSYTSEEVEGATEEVETIVFEVVKPDTEISKKPVEFSEEVKTIAEIIPIEPVESNSTYEDFLHQTEQIVDETQAQVQVVHDYIFALFPIAESPSAIQIDLQELDMCLKRINDIQEKIQSNKGANEDEAVLRGVFSKYERVAHEIKKKAYTIEQVLMQKHKAAGISEVQEVRQNVFPVTEQSLLEPDSSMSKQDWNESADRTTELEKAEEPSETDVAILMKKVTGNQFYIDAEREKVDVLYEDFHRGVAENLPVSQTVKNYEKLQQYIEKISTQPEMEHIDMRVCRILERVTAGNPVDVLIVEKVKAKCDLVVRTMADPEKTIDVVQNTYRSLEQYAKAHEAEWLAVCGLRVPVPGIEGIVTARALREGLMVARDRHKGLQRYPEKKILVDKLVRELSEIPNEGFSTDEVFVITELVRRIDETSGVESENVMPEQKEPQSIDSSENDDYGGRPQLMRKTMEIEVDDEAGEILIQVARKSEKRLVKNRPKLSESKIESSQMVTDMLNRETVEATTVAEAQDPISVIVPSKRPTIIHSRPVHEERSLTREYLNDEKYASFLRENYTSPAAFERNLDIAVTQIETETVDFIERFLKEERVSPFAYIQDMSVAEVEKMSMQPDVRNLLAEENIKYDTFVSWIDLLPEMQSVVGDSSDMKFGELYARWMVEGAMQFSEERETA